MQLYMVVGTCQDLWCFDLFSGKRAVHDHFSWTLGKPTFLFLSSICTH